MSEEEILKILSNFNKYYEGTLEDNQSSLKDLVHTLSELVESVADAKITTPSWMYHSQTLIGKIIFTSHSILSLSNGFEYAHYKRKEKAQIIDYPSMFVLTRALIENYITLCYIYNNDLSEEEKIFRFKLWEVSGLISRQTFGNSTNEEILKKKESEKLIIEKILSEIKQMLEYKNLDKSKLKKLQKYGLPRLCSWNELIEQGILRKETFSVIYSYFSSYAHSEYISILQLSQVSLNAKSVDNISNIQLSLKIVKMIISLSIDFYINNFKSAEIVYNNFPEEIRHAVMFGRELARDKKTNLF